MAIMIEIMMLRINGTSSNNDDSTHRNTVICLLFLLLFLLMLSLPSVKLSPNQLSLNDETSSRARHHSKEELLQDPLMPR